MAAFCRRDFVIQKVLDFSYYKKYHFFRGDKMKKMGRPKGENNKEHICTIRIDDDTYRRLEIYCQKLKVAKSQAIRDGIELLTSTED